MVEEIPATTTASQNRRPEADRPAERALAEAAFRRDARSLDAANLPVEVHGRGGLEPTRYGDWEVKGITSDF